MRLALLSYFLSLTYYESYEGSDNRSFADFFRQEGLIEVFRNWKKYPAGSVVQIKPNGELWIANEMADVIISDSTKAVMKRVGIWDKKLTVGKHGYVLVGTNYTKAHVKMAEAKRGIANKFVIVDCFVIRFKCI